MQFASISGPTAPASSAQPSDANLPKGDAIFGGATATVPVPDVDRVIARLRPRFRSCYRQGLLSDPTMAGKLAITAKIHVNGEVLAADATSNSGLSSAVANCVVRVVHGSIFSAPEGRKASMLTIPLTFVQQAD